MASAVAAVAEAAQVPATVESLSKALANLQELVRSSLLSTVCTRHLCKWRCRELTRTTTPCDSARCRKAEDEGPPRGD